MGRAVLLRHDLPDGSHHFDWLLERTPAGPGLVAFRVSVRLDLAVPAEFVATRMPDHRPLYLDYEGSIAGGRGEVLRLAHGRCRVWAETSDSMEASVSFAGPEVRVRGVRQHGQTWRFRHDPTLNPPPEAPRPAGSDRLRG